MTSLATAAVASTGTSTPSVLALLVVGPGASPWLRDCLLSLAHQTYPRSACSRWMTVSTTPLVRCCSASLGPRRVLTNDEPLGSARSVRAALGRPVAKGADFLLIVEPRAALDRDAVTRLVEAAMGIGVEDVGVVGAKVVDRDEPRSLRDIGRSVGPVRSPVVVVASRRDRPRTVRSGDRGLVRVVGAMLISREALERSDLFDERLAPAHRDLDFCWRTRVAGYRILMTPLARCASAQERRRRASARAASRTEPPGTRRIARRSRRCSRTTRCPPSCGSCRPRSCWGFFAWSTSPSAGGSRGRSTSRRHGVGTSPISQAPCPGGAVRRRCGGFAIARCGASWSPPVCARPDGSRRPNGSWKSSARSSKPTRVNRSSDDSVTGPHRWWAPIR